MLAREPTSSTTNDGGGRRLTAFEPLLRLDVRHDYLGHVVPPIALEPDAATQALAARPDLRLRLADGCVQLFAARDRTALTLLADRGALALTFRLRPRDPTLLAMTAAVAQARDRIAVLDRGLLPSGALHSGDAVGEHDLRPLIADRPVTEADVARPPLAVVRLVVDPQADDAAYHVRFAAVERFWTYHVIGGAADARYAVRDRSNALEFEALGPRTLPDGTRAQSFRSRVPIPERVRPLGRFELVAEGPSGPRVVLSVLPCPRPRPGMLDPEAASEVCVNLA